MTGAPGTRHPVGWRPVFDDDRLRTAAAHFLHRVLQDFYLELDATYWRRRAEQLEAARPRPGDFHGQSTRAELTARDARLAAAALACRRRAALQDLALAEFTTALGELAREAVA